jgi:hypothetical protein
MNLREIPTDERGAQFAPYLPALATDAKSVARLHFDNMAALAAVVPERDPKGDRHCGGAWEQSDGTAAFALTKNMTQALKLARDGWEEGAERARPLMDKIKTARPVRKTLSRWDVAGAVPSVPRYLAGNPMHMKTQRLSVSNRQPVVTIVSNWSTPAYVSAKVFECSAVAAAAICDRLEEAGFRVEIIAGRRCSSNTDGEKGHVAETFARIKAPEDSLDLARIAFGLGHPSALRRLSFAICSMHPDMRSATIYGQGYASDFDKAERPPGTYTMPSNKGVEANCGSDPLKAFDYVVKHLKNQGCPGLED